MRRSSSQLQNSATAYWNLEEFRPDQVGSVWYQHTRYAIEPVRPSAQSFYSGNGILYARSGAFPSGCLPGTVYIDTLYQTADPAGNVIRSGEKHKSGCDGGAHDAQMVSNAYYSADNRLMVEQKWTDGSRTWEEYWYDALGRRVLTRTRHDQPTCGFPIICPGFLERTVWDGDQLIAEERTSGLDQVTGGAPNYGTVRYVHLVGMDAPVAILDGRFSDARVIHYNWRGLAEMSSWTNGSGADVETGGSTRIAWPAGEGVYFKRNTDPYAGLQPTWIGSLPVNGKGDAGLLYRRNRFYDPASGRFTQEDPIGIAGGMNQYGFASGDPVNFSDPFGLCPYRGKHTTNVEDCPEGAIGDAFRLLKSEGGQEGLSTIRLVAANEADVKLLVQGWLDRKCKKMRATGCNDRGTIYMLDGQSMVDNATRLTHEATHFFNEEPLAWRRALTVWRRFDAALAPAMMANSRYKRPSDACRSGSWPQNQCP